MTIVTEKPSEKRVNVIPVRARIITSKTKGAPEGSASKKPMKGAVYVPNIEDIYYFPNYDASNPEHAGLGTFISHTDSPSAPTIECSELRELLTDDLRRSKSIADLLRVVYPKYIDTRNYSDAVDYAILTLRNYYGQSNAQSIIDRFDDVHFLDLKWLTMYGRALNLVGLQVHLVDHEGVETVVDGGEVRWKMMDHLAILVMSLDTTAKVRYFIAPEFLPNGDVEFKLVRAEYYDGEYSLHVDAAGNLHVVDFRTLFGSFMQYDISYASARYYVDYNRSAMATLGTMGADSANTPQRGRTFAMAHIDKTLHTDRSGYIDEIAYLADEDDIKTIDAVVKDVE